nr:polyprotein [Picornaviridae sp.]
MRFYTFTVLRITMAESNKQTTQQNHGLSVEQKIERLRVETAKRNKWFEKLNKEEQRVVTKMVKENRMPNTPRSEKVKKMVSKRGTEFEVYFDPESFYSGNEKTATDPFIHVWSLTDSDHRNNVVFTYGQMEGARRLVWRNVSQHYFGIKARKARQTFIVGVCYSILRAIQQELNGQAQETREFFSSELMMEAAQETEHVEEEEVLDWIPEPRPIEYAVRHECLIPIYTRVSAEPRPVAQVAVLETIEPAVVVEDSSDDEMEVEEQAEVQVFEDDRVQRIEQDEPVPNYLREDVVVFQKGWRLFRDGDEVIMRGRAASGMQPPIAYGVVRRRKYGFEHHTAKNMFQMWRAERQREHMNEQYRRAERQRQELGFVDEPQAWAQADVQNEVTQEQNTTFTDQRSTVMDDGYITSQIEPNMKEVSMQENQWHVRDVMSKPIPFYHGDWSTQQVQGTIIKQWEIPGDTLLGPHYNLAATFVFFRGHPTIRFQINGTKFHSGRLIAAFIPGFQFTQYDDKLYDVDQLTSLPHVILDAGFSNSGVINLPFVHMNTYFNMVQGSRKWQSLGRLVLVVFNRLGSATTSSQTIGVTAWVHYDNCELHQPCYAHTVNLPKSGQKFLEEPRPTAQAAVEGLIKSTLPMITDMVAPGLGSLVGNVAGGVADCDKPTDPVEISRWVPNAVTSLSLGSGLDKSSRLSLNTSTYTIGDADLISTTQDDMNLLEISKIPTRLCTIKWASGKNTGDRLFKIPVCPNLYNTRKQNIKVSPPVDIMTPTLLSYISRPFKFYRGGLRYKIQLIASQMHSARALIAFGPGLTDMRFDGATYINTYVIDLQERHEVEFVVPFLAERPWLRCDRMRELDVEGTTEVEHDNFENSGYLFMYVLNRLSRPDSVAAEIDVNVLVSAADDFELAVPADLACVQGIGDVIDITPGKAYAQALVGQEGVTERTEEGVVTLTKGGGKLGAAASSTLSENAMNLKTLLRRYYKVYTNKFTLPSGTSTVSFANSPTLSSVHKCFNDKNGIQLRTHLSHFSELFTFWTGSLRYKLVWSIIDDTNFPSLTVRVFHIPGCFVFGNFTPAVANDNTTAILSAMDSYGTLLGQSNIQSSLEFEVPFYTPYTQLRTIQGAVANARSCTGLVLIVIDKPAGGGNPAVNLDLYQAAGDDFGLNYLRAAPKIQFVRASEEQRDLSDNAQFIYTKIPNICPAAATETTSASEEHAEAQGLVSEAPRRPVLPVPEGIVVDDDDLDVEEQQPVAQGLLDHVPILGDHIRATRSMAAAGESMTNVCDTANHLMQQASTRLGLTESEEEEDDPTLIQSITRTASGVSDPIISIFTTLNEYIKSLPRAIGLESTVDMYSTVLDIAQLITAFNSYQNGTIVTKTLAIMSVCTVLYGAITTITKNALYTFVCRVVSNLYGCRQGNEQPAPRAESSILDFIAPLSATLSIAVGMLGFKSIPNDKQTTDIVKGISEKLRLFNFSSLALSNVKNLWIMLQDLFNWVVEKVVALFNPVLLAQLKLQREFEDVEQWAEFIDSLEGTDYEDKIHWDPDFKRKVYRAVDTGKRYNAYLVQGQIGREANVIREYVRKAMEICTRCDKSKNALPFRKDPYCIAMYGKTGVGKSGIITELAYTIMDKMNYPQHNRWCAINCNDKFFNENYAQQAAVYFDDFSTFTTEEQYQAFFNLKANTAYPLNMAFKKGEYFNSDFIFMTTNTSHPNPNCLTCIPALWRRRDALIEADFIPELQKDGMAGEFVMRDDNSHARYRLINPRDEKAEPLTQWMTYDELVIVLLEGATVHRSRQEKKLAKDLTRAGYIVPPLRAQAGVARRLCLEAMRQSPTFSLFSPDIWQHMEYDIEHEEFFMPPTAPDEIRADYSEMKQALNEMGFAGDWFKERMRMNSYVVKDYRSLTTKIKGKLSDLKALVGGWLTAIYEALPGLKTLGRCAFRLAIAMFAMQTIDSFVTSVVHYCGCAAIRYFGYRCGMCGKWPKLANSGDKEFILAEWKSLYDSQPYTDGFVTTLEQEQLIRRIQAGTTKITGIHAGTKTKADGGPYSDNTNGARIVKVMANSAPYQQETKGQPTPKVLAHGQDKHVTDLIDNRILSCLYRIRFNGSSEYPSMSMQAFAIGARSIVSLGHFFNCIKDGEYFEIFHSNAWMPVEFDSKKLHKLEGKDIHVYEMPLQFHLHKSNINHFVSEKELAYARKFPATLVKINNQLQNVLMECNVEPVEQIKYDFAIGDKEIPIKVQNAWKYRMVTAAGDCGAPLLAHCTKLQGRILGFHVCGNGIHGWSTLITREMLEKFVEIQEGSCIPKAHAKIGNLIPKGHFGRIGKSDKIFFQNDATQIIKTDIHGEISEPATFPAVLSRNDPRLTRRVNPITNGIEKYGKALKPFPQRHRDMVNDFMRSELHTFTRLRRPALLTEVETVKGIPEFEQAFEPLPLNTSPGWPYVNTRPRGESGKAYLFDINGNITDSELRRRYDEREEQALRGERVESVWIDCMKDERRALEKIQTGSTRLFTIGPVDLTLLSRKYCQDFVEAIKASRGTSHCKLGIDPQSLEWTELYTYLSSFADCMVAGDFTRFDGTVHGELIEDYFEDIDYFYREFGEHKPEDSKVRRVLADEICNTIQLAKDEFYMTHGGNPSGNQQTTPLNSRTNFRYMGLSWLGITEQRKLWKYHSMAAFNNNVRVACYGDDNILAIKRDVVEWFNQETISEYLEEYGIVYTNETKDGITKWKTLDECTFLKQGFRNHESISGIKAPIMKESTLLELLNWTRIAPDQDELLLDNCHDCLRFAYFYGKEYFNQLRTKIQHALTKHEKNFRLMTFTDYHFWFLGTIGMVESSRIRKAGKPSTDFSQHDQQ